MSVATDAQAQIAPPLPTPSTMARLETLWPVEKLAVDVAGGLVPQGKTVR